MPTSRPSNRGSTGRGLEGFRSSRRSAEHGFTSSRRSAEHGFTSSWRSAEHGFTLMEMLVVLAILGLVAAVAARSIGHRPAGLIREEGEAKLALAVDSARRSAARSGEVRTVDPAGAIPGASLSGSLPPAPGAPARPGLILIYPDGSSNGGLVSAGGRPVANVDWLTGEVRDAS